MDIAKRRIVRDTKQVIETNKTMLESQGIYYIPSDSNINYGTALLVGQPDTPYFSGYYFFSVEFPTDYPFSPLKVLSLTQDGVTRFNPNMYIQGKVCLSILNTWHDGPQWTGVQTLESVLLAIMSDVLCANPLENEPAFRDYGQSPEATLYNRLVWHSNIKTAIIKYLCDPPDFAKPFTSIMYTVFEKNKDALYTRIADSSDVDGKIERCRVFQFTVSYTFLDLLQKLKSIQNLIARITHT